MPHSVSFWFDENTESTIRDIWGELARAGISTQFHNGPYRPHITLSVYEDLDVERFSQALNTYAASKATLPVRFESLGTFAGSTGVLYLAPRPSIVLLEAQREISSLLANYGSGVSQPYYKPGLWTPHCSLAVGLEQGMLSKAFDFCQRLNEPIEGAANRIGIIKNPEEIELHEIPFRKSKVAQG